MTTNASNGGLIFFQVDDQDCAVTLTNPRISSLLVLSVLPSFRGQGIGAHCVEYLRPNFIRALESAVPFFERLGYIGFGTWKKGRTFRTRVMLRANLRGLAGRLDQIEDHTNERPSLAGVDPENLLPSPGWKGVDFDWLHARNAREREGSSRADRQREQPVNDSTTGRGATNGVALPPREDVVDEFSLEPEIHD